MNETLKEEIKFLTETVKVFWAVSIGLAGGIATLFVNPDSINKYILLALGIFFLISAIMTVNDLNKQIYKLIKEIRG